MAVFSFITVQPAKSRKPQKRPLVVSAAGKKEGGRQVISQVAKVAAFILAQFAQQLAELGRGVVAQLGFLGGELWCKTLSKGIW